MKIPLRYQMSEYDCGPTSMLNAISYLFEREEIPPEVIRNIMLYCLDCYNSEGVPGKCGTSMAAMMFLSNWLCGFGKIGRLDISSQYLSGKQGEDLLMFDPYYWEQPFEETGIRMVSDHPFAYNRIVPAGYLNRETRETYALGPYNGREAVLLFNEKTRLTEEKTIEYFI